MFKLIACSAEPMLFAAFTVMTPMCTAGFALGMLKQYLLLFTSFSIWTPSFVVSSLPFTDLCLKIHE
jgi:hypothetical protein